MHILLLGGTGRVGSLCAAEAIRRGYTVRALTRRSSEIPGAEALVTDFSRDALIKALDGIDAVVVALGHRWGQKTPFQAKIVTNLVGALQSFSEVPCIMLTGYGVSLSKERYPVMDHLLNALVATVRPLMVADGRAASEILMSSNASWTLLRAPLILRLPKVGYQLTGLGQHTRWTTCADAADALLDCAQTNKYIHQAPVVSHG